jgi:carbon monoxide dehydrogenase subunit G
MRLYSKPHDYGTSRGLEASDMVHVLKSIDEAKAFAADMNWRESPISVLDPRSVFETVVRVRRRRPEKTFVSGNVAVLVWVNQADDDLVTKTEFFTVIDPGAVVRGFGVEAIDDVRRCYARAAQFVDELHAELQQTTLNTTRRRR